MTDVAFGEHRERWAAIVTSLQPSLRRSTVTGNRWVRCHRSSSSYRGWVKDGHGELGTNESPGPFDVVDFGVHAVGQIGVQLDPDQMAGRMCQLRVGEIVDEVLESHDTPGKLGGEWLKPIDLRADASGRVLVSERRALQYLRVSDEHGKPVAVRSAWIDAVSSAEDDHHFSGREDLSLIERRLDAVSLRTLRNCMQGVFEDGPKRDRRLWLGDLRLQAQAAYLSVGGFDLVRRCLYLFALCAADDGVVPPCVYEYPDWHAGPEFIPDYALLFGPTLLDYAHASGDWGTARDLWPVALAQGNVLDRYVNHRDLFDAPSDVWQFIDWHDDLDRQAAEQGTALYGLSALISLAEGLSLPRQLREQLAQRRARMRRAARELLFDEGRGQFVSGRDRQVSWASQAWMVIGRCVEGEAARSVMKRLWNDRSDSLRPVSPYLYHHVVEALLQVGLRDEARELITEYWGGMLEHGATTFWEVHDADRPRLSPYGSHLHNSYCHAWSCTPMIWVRQGILSKDASARALMRRATAVVR